MTDAATKYRALVTACCALYGPLGPAAAWWLWCAMR